MRGQCENLLLVNVLQIIFHGYGAVPLNFLCIDVNHMVLHQSGEFHVPKISDHFFGINTAFFP